VTGIELQGSNVVVNTSRMWIFFSRQLGFFTNTSVTDPIFQDPTFDPTDSSDVYRAGEDVPDYWDTLWPNVGSYPCGPSD
jgi:hypothetical protein